MKPEFQNLDIECWEHTGPKLGIARPELCLFQSHADASRPILLALAELSAEQPPARRLVTLKPNERRKSCSTLRLRLSAASVELRGMHIARDGTVATCDMTPDGLREVQKAFINWQSGSDDFCVSPRNVVQRREFGSRDATSGELWFWGPSQLP